MQRADSISCQDCGGEVAQVVRENDLRSGLNRRRKNMTVVRVGQVQVCDVVLIAFDQVVVNRLTSLFVGGDDTGQPSVFHHWQATDLALAHD